MVSYGWSGSGRLIDCAIPNARRHCIIYRKFIISALRENEGRRKRVREGNDRGREGGERRRDE